MSEPTTERLAKALEAGGAPAEMVRRARAGAYDDYKSESACPCMDLVGELAELGLEDLQTRAMDGEWDATEEEGAAWAAEVRRTDPEMARMLDLIEGKR